MQLYRRGIRTRSLFALLLAVLFVFGSAGAFASAAEPSAEASTAGAGTAVYVVPVKQTIETGLASFLERAFGEAEEAYADTIVLVIDTNGGRLDSAQAIGKLVGSSRIPTVAFVEDKAFSAGAYIALNADRIVMQPGSSIGAAAMVDGSGTIIDNPKNVSAWTSQMRDAAEASGRNPDIAVAMADPGQRIAIPELGKTVERGDILTLTAQEARLVGYADHLAGSVEETIEWLGLEGRTIVAFNPSPAERLAQFLTQPVVMFILLAVGIAGVAIEMLVPGFGVPGITGVAAFALFFFGHYIAGFAGLESAVLFIVGIGLLVLEVFVPSFGILTLLGGAALIGGIATAAYDKSDAVLTLLAALAAGAVITGITAYAFRKRGIWNKFVLRDALTKEEGYVPAVERTDLVGKSGTAITPLRPAGTIEIDGERVDAVTDGSFIVSGAAITVTKVEGVRIVVKQVVKQG